MIRQLFIGLLFLTSISLSVPALAQTACSDTVYRQFDFWLGEWEVHTQDGRFAGTNRIEMEYDGCVIHERYVSAQGYRGESLNTYDQSRNVWHQSWVDNGGLLLLLDGQLTDGRMVLANEKHRITWTPNPDGSVRQFWESTDENGNWVVAFDGIYTKKV